ncbi:MULTISPECIES: pseudouridine synthase [Mammaliicoccus]|uniref:Pseudouridine synthase n=1 Tax=Mammaliicoccus fleurettii TaxID=150056 RepID=A0ABS5MM10_9STAP|nr:MULTISPECIES: pseudouridine synthase [Mammaliicoccus]MBL0847105.1 rRNA pseudouridine synthase [Mammaliicoccus fleurettii]MBO3062215.1 rRNA pseudouridine synthase [Mammaliicoccus fleurettii]MBS3671900.1 rRNA pseudouridine synthase [Mammaliicoccus fleurettii]MBS3696927.1 rRNA pseudouridine synthase [Mammaliicoccus fleurettii]MBW0763938.1 rRNA pseudouridine synthase [Mammaliicoccus fleurettii]
MRLDKFLANAGIGTRKEVKKFLKKNLVSVNEEIVKKPEMHINPEEDVITFDDIPIEYEPVVYLMMNKPAGYISATEDDEHETVIDIVPEYMHLDLFPVGRLDKDTEGLLLLTNDGKFSHQLMSPKHKVPKKYYVEVDGHISENATEIFKKGIDLGDFTSSPSELEIIENDESSKAFVTIYEGKFHQVKRMFQSIGCEVTYLKRIQIADLELDELLELGEYRHLMEEDFKLLNL